MRRIAEITLMIAVVVAISGCGGVAISNSTPSSPSSPQSSSTVVVTPENATVYQGATAKFQAQVEGQTNQAVTWSVEHSFGTIDSSGLYTAPREAYGGPFHVVATSQAVPSAQGSALVTVAPIQVMISPATITLAPGGTQPFTATVVGLANTQVIWAVQESTGGSVTVTGFYTAPFTNGFYHVVATSVADATHSGSATIAVTTSPASFKPTGSMLNARGLHTATLLANGRVLVVGGASRADPICLGGMTSAELYDPSAGSFTPTGDMATLRYAHAATSLLNGKVLVTGGFGSGVDCEDLGEPSQNGAELYDPSTGSFKATGSMVVGRGGHTATLLPNGKVLVAGGGDQGGGAFPFYGVGSASAELYDPTTNVFIPTGNMAAPRFGHTATLLANGKVLIVGGIFSSASNPTAASEIYDPASGTFTPTGSMTTTRMGHTATRLPDGRVLISGGFSTGIINGEFTVSLTAEVYDPGTGSFSVTGQMGIARALHTATLLPNGTVLVAGGGSSTAEVYDPVASSFNTTGGMETQRAGHSATQLQNGRVLVVGGGHFLATAELYE